MSLHYPGFFHEVNRVALLEKAKSASSLGLLECALCGWSWLKVETAAADWELNVVCRDEYACFRRQQMKMR